MKALIRKYPLASYFTLAFAISWAGVLAVAGGGPFPGAPRDVERLFVFAYLAMLLGPSVAGIALIRLTSGRHGLREYRSRLLKWRVAAGWYAMAVLAAPFALTITLFLLSLTSPEFTPGILTVANGEGTGPIQATSQISFLVQCLVVGIGAGLFEELGWTGFAVPRLSERHTLIATGLLVGVLWGLWHLLAIWWGSATAFGSASVPLFLTVALLSFLPPYRVLMVWVYSRTRSLFLGIVMHASLTASMLILGPNVTGSTLITYDLTFAAVLWVFVAFALPWTARKATTPVTTHLGRPAV